MTYVSNTPRLEKLVARLAPKGKAGEAIAALKSQSAPPTSAPSDTPSDSAATARFIVSANERRIAKCQSVAPSGDDEASRTAKFISECNERRLGRSA